MAELFIVELITLILSYLPVTSLIRFKSVSKEWYSLISSPYFIDLHRKNPQSANRRFVIANHRDDDSYWERRAIDANLTLTTKFYLPSITRDDAFFHIFNDRVEVVGSCHGLMVFNITRVYNDEQFEVIGRSSKCGSDLVMWNPSINKYVVLPPMPSLDSRFAFAYYGFGYDKSTDDYKVVVFSQKITGFDDTDEEHRTTYCQRVYSAKRNSWQPPRYGKTSYMNYWDLYPAVVYDHILYWYFGNEDPNKAGYRGFDICTEEWLNTELPLPEFDADAEVRVMGLGVLNNWLCIVSIDDVNADVWVMKEYGVKESWTKLVSLPNGPEIQKRLHGPPIAYFDGQLLLKLARVYGTHFWYNVKDKTVRSTGHFECISVTICSESLVPVPRPTKDDMSGSFKHECVTIMEDEGVERSSAIDLEEFLRIKLKYV